MFKTNEPDQELNGWPLENTATMSIFQTKLGLRNFHVITSLK